MFGYTAPVNEKWEEQYDEGRKISKRATRHNFVRIKGAGLLVDFLALGMAALLLFPVREGAMEAGTYVALVGAILGITKLMSWNMSYLIEDFISNKEYIRDFLCFMELPEECAAEGASKQTAEQVDSIEFDRVSFRYPGCEQYVLREMSFKMERGKTYAFVGENGAGKTTITKLLLGLYREYEGVIRINGQDIRHMGTEELFRFFSVAYQDFPRYEVTLRENLALGRAQERQASEQEIREIIDGFVGEYDQIPPMYSALKVGGKKLCDLAREGREIERKPRRITFHEIEVKSVELPFVSLRVSCSKGTYIRTLCHDIGERAGCGGTMVSLRRTRSGSFREADAITLDELTVLRDAGAVETVLIPVEEMFPDLGAVHVQPAFRKLLVNGNTFLPEHIMERRRYGDGEEVCVYDDGGTFFGVYVFEEARRSFRPVKMFFAS